MERLVNLSEGGTPDAAVLGLVPASHGAQTPADSSAPGTEVRSLRSAEREAIVQALKAHRYNVTRAAQALGIAKPTLYAKLRLHGIAL